MEMLTVWMPNNNCWVSPESPVKYSRRGWLPGNSPGRPLIGQQWPVDKQRPPRRNIWELADTEDTVPVLIPGDNWFFAWYRPIWTINHQTLYIVIFILKGCYSEVLGAGNFNWKLEWKYFYDSAMQIMFYWCSTSFGQGLMLPVVCSAALLPRLSVLSF